MTVEEQDDGLATMELRFSNIVSDDQGDADFAFEDEELLALGSRVRVKCGDEQDPTEVFYGVVTGLEARFPQHDPPELVVFAEDVLQKARMRRRTKTYEEGSLQELVDAVLEGSGVTTSLAGLSATVGVQVQRNESDLAFLRRVLDRHDVAMWVQGDTLHAAPRDQDAPTPVEVHLHSQLREARVFADLAHQVTQITLTGWDAAEGQRVGARAGGSAAPGPGAGRIGAELLPQELRPRSEHLGHLAVEDSAEADALVEAAWRQRARRFVVLEGTCAGNPALRVGAHVAARGLGPRFSNTYLITRACHRFDLERGYETDIEAACAYLGDAG
ncbi:MAG: hypothetical protein H6739_35370 [Alphaproteobacteria bacterium]|nr:hypothetical protein [Alphaproteobacteria bacterium]